MPSDTTLPSSALELLEAVEKYAHRLPEFVRSMSSIGSSAPALPRDMQEDLRFYTMGTLTDLNFGDIKVRVRLQHIIVDWRLGLGGQLSSSDQELWNDAVFDLVWQLQSGTLRAWGREGTPMGRLINIPCDTWVAILPSDVDWSRGSVPKWGLYCIVVAPTAPESETPAEASTISAERNCQARLEELMANGSKPDKTKSEYCEELCSEFKVSSRGFGRAWGQAVGKTGNSAWKKPGRKSRHRIDTPV